MGQEVVQVLGSSVAVAAGVEHECPAVHPAEGQAGLETRGSAADHDDVVHEDLLGTIELS